MTETETPTTPAAPGTDPLPPQPPAPQPNWWQRRSLPAKVGLVILALFVLIGVFAEDPEDTSGSDKPAKKATTKVDAGGERKADKPEPEAKKPATPANPVVALSKDIQKNAADEVGKSRVKSAGCAREGKDILCTVDYRLGAMWDADDNEVARDIGGMLHELFRDTDVDYLHVNALTTTVNALGKETKDDRAAWVIIRRSGWEQVDWDNLQYQEPADGLRMVSEVYADTLTN